MESTINKFPQKTFFLKKDLRKSRKNKKMEGIDKKLEINKEIEARL
ncbi:hypothetical protein X843_2056 [Listeria monocytogenes Lm_1840]|nr:hypothetical protein X843_2056 [Listeria monocytogenes Lm_1840]QBZ18482.1 hypothetical protein FORC68_1254 [Listeria monocytogenes]